MMIDQKFGKVLRKLRCEKGLSQEELALNVGLHRTYISQLERGLKSPSLKTIKRISDELGTTASEIMRLVEKE